MMTKGIYIVDKDVKSTFL